MLTSVHRSPPRDDILLTMLAVYSGYGNSSYYNKNAHSPALIRARRPYLLKNALVGSGIAAFAIGVCA
jgi:hypothetical protein